MDHSALYKSKVKSAADAVADIPSGSKLAMGMAVAEPPALLDALAKRAEAGSVGDLQVYYFESMKTAGQSILRYELNDRIQPYCMFVVSPKVKKIREKFATRLKAGV